jgi:hypothetical protein
VAPVDAAAPTRIRASWWRIAGYPAQAVVFGVVCWMLGPANSSWRAAILLNLAIAVAASVQRWGYGITLTKTHALVHHGYRRSTNVRWTRVQEITRESTGVRKRIALWTEDGRQIVLDEPRSLTGHGHFDRSFRAIHEWWLARR